MITAVSPSGSNTNPRSEPEVRTRSPSAFTRVSRSSTVAPTVAAYGLTASTDAPILLSTCGITTDVAPYE